MATYAKQCLAPAGVSTNGKQIKVAATSSPGTTLHTAVAGTASLDEIWLYAYNSDTASHTLTIQWGGTSTPDNDIKITLAAQAGRVLVIDGMLLQNSLIVKAWADTTNVVILDGFVNNIA